LSRVKISKEEMFDKHLPTLCMVCGKNQATARVPHVARKVGFPANLFGLMGKYLLASKRWKMEVIVCDQCKAGFKNERVLSDLWKTVHLFALIGIGYYLYTDPGGMPKNLMVPGIMLLAVLVLETIHFFAIGKKNAIRLLDIEKHFVSFEFPNGRWGVAYTAQKREQGADMNRGRPTPTFTPPPAAFDAPPLHTPPASPSPPPVGPPQVSPPPGAPQVTAPTDKPSLDSFFQEPTPPGAPATPPDYLDNPTAPPAPVITHASEDLTMVAFEGSELAFIPEDLPDLFKVIKLGDTDLLEDALGKGADVNETLENGMNGLHVAAIAGVMQVADLLIRRGLSPNSEMANGLTPMHLAVQSNSQNLVGIMLAKKGNPNHPNAQGRTPLHWCAAVKDDRLEPKHRLQIAKMLRRGGGDVTLQDHQGKTPTELAKLTGDTMLVDALS
jgi:ankyrin repeat protein